MAEVRRWTVYKKFVVLIFISKYTVQKKNRKDGEVVQFTVLAKLLSKNFFRELQRLGKNVGILEAPDLGTFTGSAEIENGSQQSKINGEITKIEVKPVKNDDIKLNSQTFEEQYNSFGAKQLMEQKADRFQSC